MALSLPSSGYYYLTETETDVIALLPHLPQRKVSLKRRLLTEHDRISLARRPKLAVQGVTSVCPMIVKGVVGIAEVVA